MSLQRVGAVRRLREAHDEHAIGRLGGVGVAIFEEIAGVLQDLRAGRIVGREETGGLERMPERGIACVPFGEVGIIDVARLPCVEKPDLLAAGPDQFHRRQRLIVQRAPVTDARQGAVTDVPAASARPAQAVRGMQHLFADLADRKRAAPMGVGARTVAQVRALGATPKQHIVRRLAANRRIDVIQRFLQPASAHQP